MCMAYCSSCGEKIPEDAFFCPKCGVKTVKGSEANVKYPIDEMREAFAKMGVELEKAFRTAAVEVHAAFKKAAADMNQKAAEQKTTVCPKCNATNSVDAVFCRSCGGKLSSD